MKILIIGFGSVAKKHYQALTQIDQSVQVVALRNRMDAESIDNILSVYNITEIWQNGPYEFVIISNPTYKHAETIELVLGLNCPLFIEKPLFDTLEASKVIEMVSASGNLTYVACNLRFLDSLIYLKEVLLPKIIINEVNVYCGSYLPDWRIGVDYKSIYSAHSNLGGGVHLDLIHELDYVYWLFGKPMQVNSYKRNKSTLVIDAIDYANYLLEYREFAVNIVLNYYRKDKKRTIELVCSDDTYTVNLFSNMVTSSKNLIYESNQDLTDTYKKQIEYFIGKITGPLNKNEKIMNSIEEAYEVLKICLQ